MADDGKHDDMMWAIVLIIVIVVILYIAWKAGWLKKVAGSTGSGTSTTPTTGTTGTPGSSGAAGGSTPNPSPPPVVATPPTTSGATESVTVSCASNDTAAQYWAVFSQNPGTYLGNNQWSNAQPISDTIQMAGDTMTLNLAPGGYWFSTTGGSTYNVTINGQNAGTTTYGSVVTFTV